MERIFTVHVLIISIFLVSLFSFNLTSIAQEIKLTKRVMSDSEFKKFKNFVGTYEKGKSYNQIINGHGTGLMPPTEEQWNEMKNEPNFVDKIEFPLKKVAIPSSCDNSSTNWFPPIGDQGSENSCVSWACGYYIKTFQEAKERNWDLSGCKWKGGYYGYPSEAYQDKIFSPDFIYHQVNNGGNNSTRITDNMYLLQNIGCCTWDKMPYSSTDHTSWPSESAWRQAPWYRSQSGYCDMDVSTDKGIIELKHYLSEGNLVITFVAADFYSDLTSKDLWTLDNYNPSSINHANTVVGYDDYYGPYTESGNSNKYGAFKVANSWGVGGWENKADGFYYISYECMKQRIKYAYFYQNLENYVPQIVAVFEINNCFRSDNKITFGLGNPYSPSSLKKTFPGFTLTGGNLPYPNHPIVIDITDFLPYLSESTNQFFIGIHKVYGSSTAVLQSFSVEMYDDYTSGVPKNVYVSTETPMNGPQQNKIMNVSVFTGPLPVELTSFNAVVKNFNVILNWETATEINNHGFEIERKVCQVTKEQSNSPSNINNVQWQKIGFIHGHGNSNSPKSYKFTDNNLNGGSNFRYRLEQIYNDGKFEYSNSVKVTILPLVFQLFPNYPNPFNPSTTIHYSIPKQSYVVLKIYDILGREIATLVNETKAAGNYKINWNGNRYANGIYFYQLMAGDYVQTRKMILLK